MTIDKRVTPITGLIVVLSIGFLIRLYACLATFIIPPDGALYLYQAKMIVNGQWGNVTGCGLSYLSNLPLLIAGFYLLIPDWVIAAQAVSLFFGTATLVSAYAILRQFCDRESSLLATLILALTPVMVSRSADVVRGPVFWFFLSIGIYAFIIGLKRKRPASLFIIAQLAFLMAVWARIEGLLVIPVSLVYLAVHYRHQCIRPLLAFSIPLLVLTLSLLVVSLSMGKNFHRHYRADEVLKKAISLHEQFDALREQINAAVTADTPEPLRWYLQEAKTTMWLVAIGVLLNRIAEAFFYPFLIFYLLGCRGIRRRVGDDRRLVYPIAITICVALMLYAHTLETWVLHYRMMVFMILPSALLAGFGLNAIGQWVSQTYRLHPKTVFIGLGIFILLAGLPKNLKLRDPEKKVFKDIGYTIAERNGHPRGVRISTSRDRHRWITFYANQDVENPPCPQPAEDHLWPISDAELNQTTHALIDRGYGYYLWEEKSWSESHSIIDNDSVKHHMRLVGQWQHPDTGKLMLFRLTSVPNKPPE